MISFDFTVNVKPGGDAALAFIDESPCMPVSKLPCSFFTFTFFLPMRPANEKKAGPVKGGNHKALNQDTIIQLGMHTTIVKNVITEPGDFQMRRLTG